jgi:hypothetical protein
MSFGATLFAMAAVQGISQITQGYAQKEEAKFNASLAEGKANLIGAQQEIDAGQYQRLKGQYMSTSMANIAKAGIMPTGSAMAVMLNTQTQINIDQAISKFNLEQQKQYTLSEANALRRQGRQSVSSGYSNAFSTVLSGASDFAKYKRFNLNAGAT